MSIYNDAEQMGVAPVESEYKTEVANNFLWKMKAFAEKFYGPLAGKPVEFLATEYFERYYDKVKGNAALAEKRTEHTAEYYAEITKDMFYRGGQLAWRIYLETVKFTEPEEEHRGTILMNLKCSMDFKPANILTAEGTQAVEAALEGIYSVMLMDPLSVPESEEEMYEFSKVAFDLGFTVIWRYLATIDIEREKKKDKFSAFTVRKNKNNSKKRERLFR